MFYGKQNKEYTVNLDINVVLLFAAYNYDIQHRPGRKYLRWIPWASFSLCRNSTMLMWWASPCRWRESSWECKAKRYYASSCQDFGKAAHPKRGRIFHGYSKCGIESLSNWRCAGAWRRLIIRPSLRNAVLNDLHKDIWEWRRWNHWPVRCAGGPTWTRTYEQLSELLRSVCTRWKHRPKNWTPWPEIFCTMATVASWLLWPIPQPLLRVGCNWLVHSK